MKILVAHQVDIFSGDVDGKTPQWYALAKGHEAIARYLDQLKKSPDEMDYHAVHSPPLSLREGLVYT